MYYRISKLFPAYLAMRSGLAIADCKDSIQKQDTLTGPFLQIGISAHPYAKVRLNLLEDVLERRRSRHIVRNREGKSMCLTGSMIWILAKYHDLDLIHRREVKSPEYLASRREYPLSCRLFFMKKTHQRREIWFLKFARQCVFPTLFYAYFHNLYRSPTQIGDDC